VRARLVISTVLAAFAAFAVACASSGTGTGTGTGTDSGADAALVLPDTGAVITYPDSREGRIAARLASCRGVEPGCHGDGASLVLGRLPAEDFAALIGVPSTEAPTLAFVSPGAPSRSWVYLKVAAAYDAGVETPMPLGTDGDPAFAATLAAWITAGAPDPFADAGDAGSDGGHD
jgi:hypothetical protein